MCDTLSDVTHSYVSHIYVTGLQHTQVCAHVMSYIISSYVCAHVMY